MTSRANHRRLQARPLSDMPRHDSFYARDVDECTCDTQCIHMCVHVMRHNTHKSPVDLTCFPWVIFIIIGAVSPSSPAYSEIPVLSTVYGCFFFQFRWGGWGVYAHMNESLFTCLSESHLGIRIWLSHICVMSFIFVYESVTLYILIRHVAELKEPCVTY